MSTVRTVLATLAVVALATAFTPAVPTAASATHQLPLHSGVVDPAVDLPAADPAGEDLVLVQFEQRGATALVDALPGTGATLVQPLAPVSYLVWADAASTRDIRALDGVRFAGVLPAAARVHPSAGDTGLLRVTTIGMPTDLVGAALSTTARTFTGTRGGVLVLPGDAEVAARLAARPDVYSVAAAPVLRGEQLLRDERTAAIVGEGLADPAGPYEPAGQFGVDGSDVVVAVVDGGVDTTHPELSGMLSGREITCTPYTPGGEATCLAGSNDDVIGHGTHVTGIVMGDGSTGIGDAGLGGFRFGSGVAPGADLHVQNAINLTGILNPLVITDLFQDSYRNGASVVQNSWGPSGTPQGYDEDTRQADAAVRDADPDEPGDQQLGVVFSIMNGSGGTSTQGAPDEGKNILAIGGSKSGRPASGGTGDDLCSCSGHGPNLDGSRLVDLVAPGQAVMSTAASYGVLCGVPSTEFPSPIHGECTGTSMASPHVSGAYALVTEAHRTAHGTDPSPALVKAVLVNTAVDLARVGPVPGRDADGRPMTPVPNEQQGWGRLDVGTALAQLGTGTLLQVDQDRVFDASGEVAEYTVEVTDPTASLRITLAYTDAFGHGQGGELRSLVNDLDLEVVAPDGTVHLGNVFADGRSVPGGERDSLNNLENVWFDAATAGTWTIRVRATEIIGDGLPSSGDSTDQDFALVVGTGG